MNHSRRILPAVCAVALVVAWAAPATAGFVPIAQPGAAYLGATALLPVSGADFDVVPSLAGGGVTATFDVGLTILTTPTSWGSWGSPPDTESATPRVLWTNGLTELTITFSQPVSLFGLEAQPNTAVVSTMTAEFFFGASSLGQISLDVDGNGGARLFAALSTDPFDRVVISSTDDFAVAQLRVAPLQVEAVPEPSSLAGLIAGVSAIVIFARRRGHSLERMESQAKRV